MEADVEGLIGAGRHERSGDRLNYRYGYRDRTLDTRLGSLQLRIQKLRQRSYFPPWRHVADQLRPRWPKLAALMDDSEHDVLAHGLPGAAPNQAPQNQPARATEQGGQTPRRCRRHLPERGQRHPIDRCCPVGTKRRVDAPAPLHADRGMAELTPATIDSEPTKLRPKAARPMATSSSTPIYPTLTDVTRQFRQSHLRRLSAFSPPPVSLHSTSDEAPINSSRGVHEGSRYPP